MENHRVQEMMRLMASKIRSIANTISDEDVEKFLNELLNAKRIYVIGAGRSGLVAKAFAMRLMHLGLHAYVVGETITPALNKGRCDGRLLGLRAGPRPLPILPRLRTRSVHISASSPRMRIPGSERSRTALSSSSTSGMRCRTMPSEFEIRQMMGEHKSFAPLGTLFETASMIFADAVISRLMEITKTDESALKNRHTNIE